MKTLLQIRLPKNALIQSDEDIEVQPPPEHGHDLLFMVFCNGIPIAQARLEREHQNPARHNFAGSVLMFTEHYMPSYRITAIEVDPAHRNRGIGTVLLREIMHYCQNHRVNRLLAEVASHGNTKLQNWYLSHGFNFADVDLLELTLN